MFVDSAIFIILHFSRLLLCVLVIFLLRVLTTVDWASTRVLRNRPPGSKYSWAWWRRWSCTQPLLKGSAGSVGAGWARIGWHTSAPSTPVVWHVLSWLMLSKTWQKCIQHASVTIVTEHASNTQTWNVRGKTTTAQYECNNGVNIQWTATYSQTGTREAG